MISDEFLRSLKTEVPEVSELVPELALFSAVPFSERRCSIFFETHLFSGFFRFL